MVADYEAVKCEVLNCKFISQWEHNRKNDSSEATGSYMRVIQFDFNQD